MCTAVENMTRDATPGYSSGYADFFAEHLVPPTAEAHLWSRLFVLITKESRAR
jgi:hypothetical protein